MTRQRIACIVGPTASGKTALAVALAERLGAEIVSADSRQLYRALDIGTAKPSAAERARVRHHCLDLVEPGTRFDAARFRTAAAAALADVAARGKVAFVVGGTGLYLRVLLGGLCPAPPAVPALRAALGSVLATRGADALHRGLAALDAATAARVHPHDAVRIVRALEVGLATGVPLSAWQADHRFAATAYEPLVIGLARPVEELDRRIAARVDAMATAGFLGEVRALHARGLGPTVAALGAVGYAELLAYIEGRASLESALAATTRATRRFAKRQRTWFRRDPAIRWRHPERDRGRIEHEVAQFLTAGGAPA